MTVSNSIFQQLCPACASSIPINAQRCECGHDLTGTAGSPLESTLRDEELYENYLAARVEQAHESAHIASRAAEEDLENLDLQEAATLAREVAESLAADLTEQRAKLQKLRALIPPPVVALPPVEPARTEPVPAPVVAAAPVQSNPGIRQPVVKPVETEPRPAAAAPVAEPAAVLLTQASVTTKTPIEADTPSPVPALATPAPVVMQKAAKALSALKQAKAREGAQQLAALRAQIARQKKAEQERLEKAEREAEQKRQAQLSSTPPVSFREEQAARAERALQDHHQLSGKDCPNCTSRVPLNTTRCQCGFTFAGGDTELPSLTLCTGDFTALRNTFLSDLRGRR